MKKTVIILLNVVIINLLISQFMLSAETVFNYNSKNRRDPFVPLVSETGVYAPGMEMNIESVADIVLEGTMLDPSGNSLAIINGQIVKTGEQIGAFKVIKVEAARVTVSANDREYIINLSSE